MSIRPPLLLRPIVLPTDGRQSPVAAGVQRGVRRLFVRTRPRHPAEFTLGQRKARRPHRARARTARSRIIEIKSSVVDFRADRRWPDYEDFCDRFYFAVPETGALRHPARDRGLIVADSFGAAVLRALRPTVRLAGARRQAVTLRLPMPAAALLHSLADPDRIADGAALSNVICPSGRR